MAAFQFSNDVECKLAKFLQLIGTIKRIIFRKVRMETILKIYNTFLKIVLLIVPINCKVLPIWILHHWKIGILPQNQLE